VTTGTGGCVRVMERQTVRDAHVPVGDAVPFGALSSAYDIYSHGGTFDVGDVASCQGRTT